MSELEKIADLLKRRRQIDEEISKIISRPSLPSHIGEFIASKVFGIRLKPSAASKGIDGVFVEGPLKGKTVNVKMYGNQEGILDITLKNMADYYLVLTGPKSQPTTSRGESRPIVISIVYLFKMTDLVHELKKRGVKIGIATSMAKRYWEEARVYPDQVNKAIELTKEQLKLLALFPA